MIPNNDRNTYEGISGERHGANPSHPLAGYLTHGGISGTEQTSHGRTENTTGPPDLVTGYGGCQTPKCLVPLMHQ